MVHRNGKQIVCEKVVIVSPKHPLPSLEIHINLISSNCCLHQFISSIQLYPSKWVTYWFSILIIFLQSLSKMTFMYPLLQQCCIAIINTCNSLLNAFLTLVQEACPAPLYAPLESCNIHLCFTGTSLLINEPLTLHLI